MNITGVFFQSSFLIALQFPAAFSLLVHKTPVCQASRMRIWRKSRLLFKQTCTVADACGGTPNYCQGNEKYKPKGLITVKIEMQYLFFFKMSISTASLLLPFCYLSHRQFKKDLYILISSAVIFLFFPPSLTIGNLFNCQYPPNDL